MADRRDRDDTERVIPSGMGGAGGGDRDDVGDVGYPEEGRDLEGDTQARNPVARQGIAREGMGGAGGGDRDDMGDVGFPDNRAGDDISGTPGTEDEYQREFRQAQGVTGARAQDIEIARQMGGGDTGTAPGIPQGDLSLDEVQNARETARGLGGEDLPMAGGTSIAGGDEDVGAPWEDVDEGTRMRTPENYDLESGDRDKKGS